MEGTRTGELSLPNRIIKESICESENLNQCEPGTREFFQRLTVYADDYGRFNADLTILRARLYPREIELMTLAEIEEMLIELGDNDLITFYSPRQHMLEKIKIYGQIIQWDKHQRVRFTKAKQPIPENGDWLNDWALRRFIPAALKDAVLERDKYTCQECKFQMRFPAGMSTKQKRSSLRGNIHIDHIVQVCLGGRATMENLRVLCRFCNERRPRKLEINALAWFNGSAAVCGILPQVAASGGELRPVSGSGSQSGSQSNPEEKESAAPPPLALGEKGWVKVSEEEHGKLKAELGSHLESFIQQFDDWVEENPDAKDKSGIKRRARNPYLSIRKWYRTKIENGTIQPRASPPHLVDVEAVERERQRIFGKQAHA